MTSSVVRRNCFGTVTRVVGAEIEVRGLRLAVGDAIEIASAHGTTEAEVVAVHPSGLRAVVVGTNAGLAAGDRTRPCISSPSSPVGDGLIGRIIDGLGRPIDGRGPVQGPRAPLHAAAPPAMSRRRVDRPLATGVRMIDGLCTLARGQRIGLFAGSGVGKSTLLAMMVRGTDADRSVVALVGERGREVREFVEDVLGPEGMARSVVVVATSDEPALVRLRAALTATTIAESFADDGLDVLLTMDSVTRIAAAQREIGLAAGEPPTTRGYPPSVFSLLPRLLERAGPRTTGTITSITTVLVEGGDHDEPIADTVRGILDGHIVLDRSLTARGHFPAIDPLSSLSRLADRVNDPNQQRAARTIRHALAALDRTRDLVELGAYVAGADPVADAALARQDDLNAFLTQPADSVESHHSTWQRMTELAGALVPATTKEAA